MGEFARAAALLALVIGAYSFGRHDGRAIRAEIAVLESAAIIKERDESIERLVESERRITELQASARSVGTSTRTVIQQVTELRNVPVPAHVSERLLRQAERTRIPYADRHRYRSGGSGREPAEVP